MSPARTILIVDDESDVLEWLEKKLSAENYAVITAQTAWEALEKTKKDPPQLILMDIVLPDMEGSEVVKMLVEDPLTRDIPVVFISGIISKENQAMDLEVKVAGRLYKAVSKPFGLPDILKAIKQALGEKQE